MSDSPPPVLDLQSIEKAFHGRPVLRGLTLTVGAGELVGLIGPNGVGKSTALKILTGELIADAGTARIAGHGLVDAPTEARRALGFVPQDGGLEPFLTGEEVLRLVAELRAVAAEPVVPSLLSRFGLTEAKNRLVREYSEGMTKRLAIAAALIGEPAALVLDESLNGLDPRGARLVREVLTERRSQGAAILITGHVLETLERLCTRVVLLHAGRVAVDLGRPQMDALAARGESLEDVFLRATE